MRGLRAVLYIAVLLCVAQFASADCGANGNYADGATGGHCVCLSGYSDANCGTAPDASCGAGVIASATQADHFPTLDLNSAAYTLNTLRVTLLGPYVQGRKYNSIIFVNQTLNSCSLGFGTSFWSTNVSACQDSFHIDMPWINHAACGFSVNDLKDDSTNDLANEDNQTAISQNHYVSFAARFTLNYTDILGSIEGFNLTRNTAVPYRIFVQFPTQLDVSISNVNIKSEVEMGFALTGDNFDPDTRVLTIEMTIINSWPNMLEFHNGQYWQITPPPGIDQDYDAAPGQNGMVLLSDQTSDCPNDPVAKPLCKQVFQFQFSTDSLCTYDGTYNWTTVLYTCRDGQYTSCTSLLWNVWFDMETSSICSSINTTLVLKGHLSPFHTAAGTVDAPALPFSGDASTDGFTIGSYGYFQVVLEDMQGNDVELDFYEISFQANGFTNKNYLMRNNVTMDSDNLPTLPNNDSTDAFHYSEAKLFIDNHNKFFSVYFSSVVFKVLPSSVTTYTFRASAYATYTGNDRVTTKRSVEFAWDAPAVENQQMSTFAKVGLRTAPQAVNIVQEQNGGNISSGNLAYIIGGGGAGLVLIVLAVIGLAIHHKKRQVAKALAEATRA